MKNRRLTSLIILTAASVFLFFCLSCGIPTYIVPKVSFSTVSSGDNTDTFKVTYSCEDVVGDQGRIGLLLLYYVDSTAPSSNSAIVSKFKNTFVPTSYNGVNVDVEQNTPVLNITVTSSGENKDINLYAFTLNGSLISDPLYTFSLPVTGDFTKKVTLNYKDDGIIGLNVDGSQTGLNLGLDPLSQVNDGNYIAVYAAVSVKSTSFTNHYWSDLKFVGYIRVAGESN